MKKILFLALILTFFCPNVFAIPYRTEVVGEVEVRSGISTEDIMPVLIKVTKKYKKYLRSIYGHSRKGQVIIIIKIRSGLIDYKSQLNKIVGYTYDSIRNTFPFAKGKIKLSVWGATADNIRFRF